MSRTQALESDCLSSSSISSDICANLDKLLSFSKSQFLFNEIEWIWVPISWEEVYHISIQWILKLSLLIRFSFVCQILHINHRQRNVCRCKVHFVCSSTKNKAPGQEFSYKFSHLFLTHEIFFFSWWRI